jgi:hypothetical protein
MSKEIVPNIKVNSNQIKSTFNRDSKEIKGTILKSEENKTNLGKGKKNLEYKSDIDISMNSAALTARQPNNANQDLGNKHKKNYSVDKQQESYGDINKANSKNLLFRNGKIYQIKF